MGGSASPGLLLPPSGARHVFVAPALPARRLPVLSALCGRRGAPQAAAAGELHSTQDPPTSGARAGRASGPRPGRRQNPADLLTGLPVPRLWASPRAVRRPLRRGSVPWKGCSAAPCARTVFAGLGVKAGSHFLARFARVADFPGSALWMCESFVPRSRALRPTIASAHVLWLFSVPITLAHVWGRGRLPPGGRGARATDAAVLSCKAQVTLVYFCSLQAYF